ncbi:MAG: SAM-dependent methyltransferase [Prevotella sp.]|nr:SAM-dependent methyltransferase [Prevotella sp.]
MNIEEFIREHREDDVRLLALQGKRYPDVDMAFALQQIAGWQTARKKIPSWAAIEGILYPPHLSMEQCSSEQTARYKAGIVSRCGGTEVRGYEKCDEAHDGIGFPRRRRPLVLVPSHPRTPAPPKKIVDLTGGLGVDFAFLAQAMMPAQSSVCCGSAAATATYVERQPHLCEAARHNFALLGLTQAEVVCADATDYLHQMLPAYLIYIDPARRDTKGARTYAISDCTPNVLEIEQELLDKGEWVLLKLSPMLDWHKAVNDLNTVGDVVREVHIVSVDNECKELLLLLSAQHSSPLTISCVNNDEVFCFSGSENGFRGCGGTRVRRYENSFRGRGGTRVRGYENGFRGRGGTRVRGCENSIEGLDSNLVPPYPRTPAPRSTDGNLVPPYPRTPAPRHYLYEPNSSVMKAGCFDVLQKRYDVAALGKNSHLFVSDGFIEDFPGRKFQILAVLSMKRFATNLLPDATAKANIAVRNFPMTAEALRKKLKLKDGGDTYIFGTTIEENSMAEKWNIKTGPALLIAKKT